jgi:hypothetical protein
LSSEKTMSRAYIVYFLMIAILAGGLAVVVTLGESVRAPDDLSGRWTINWEKAPPEFVGQGEMRIDQSGKFFTIHFEKGPTLTLKLEEKWRGSRDGRQLWMSLDGKPWTLTCSGPISTTEPRRANVLDIQLRGSGSSFSASAARKTDSIAKGAEPSTPLAPAKTADAR